MSARLHLLYGLSIGPQHTTVSSPVPSYPNSFEMRAMSIQWTMWSLQMLSTLHCNVEINKAIIRPATLNWHKIWTNARKNLNIQKRIWICLLKYHFNIEISTKFKAKKIWILSQVFWISLNFRGKNLNDSDKIWMNGRSVIMPHHSGNQGF